VQESVIAFTALQWLYNVVKQNMAALPIKRKTLSLQEKPNVIRSRGKSKFYTCSTSKRVEHVGYHNKWHHGKGRCSVHKNGGCIVEC
jgi:hypothetical protein